jgi:hypothetical protein
VRLGKLLEVQRWEEEVEPSARIRSLFFSHNKATLVRLSGELQKLDLQSSNIQASYNTKRPF